MIFVANPALIQFAADGTNINSSHGTSIGRPGVIGTTRHARLDVKPMAAANGWM
jgi:hypothetical protein